MCKDISQKVWCGRQLLLAIKPVFINDMLRIHYTEDDTITQSGNKTARKNSDGHALLVRVVICNEWKWFFTFT
jgi:hypothetical protein